MAWADRPDGIAGEQGSSQPELPGQSPLLARLTERRSHCHLRDIRHQPSLSGGQRMGNSHASERICRPKNLPITTDDMETELGRLRDTDIDDDSPVIRSKDRRRKLTDECKRQPLAAYRFGGLGVHVARAW